MTAGGKQILFLHGAGVQPDDPEWGAPAFTETLLAPVYGEAQVRAPKLGDPDDPAADLWLSSIADAMADFPHDGIVLGHSLGGSTFLQFATQRRPETHIAALFLLAAPFWGAGGWDADEFKLSDGFEKNLDGIERIVIGHGTADEIVSADHARRYAELIPRAEIHLIEGAGHDFRGGSVGALTDALREVLSA